MRVNVQNLEGQVFEILCEPTSTVPQFKTNVHLKTGVRPDDQTLLYLGGTLESGTLMNNNVIEGCTINMVHRSVGGHEADESDK